MKRVPQPQPPNVWWRAREGDNVIAIDKTQGGVEIKALAFLKAQKRIPIQTVFIESIEMPDPSKSVNLSHTDNVMWVGKEGDNVVATGNTQVELEMKLVSFYKKEKRVPACVHIQIVDKLEVQFSNLNIKSES